MKINTVQILAVYMYIFDWNGIFSSNDSVNLVEGDLLERGYSGASSLYLITGIFRCYQHAPYKQY